LASLEGKTLKVVVDMLKMYAYLLSTIAEIEEVSGKRFDEFLKELLSLEKLLGLYGRLPPEVYAEFMAAMLRLASLSATVQNPLALPTSEKRRVSAEVLEIAGTLERVVEKLGVG